MNTVTKKLRIANASMTIAATILLANAPNESSNPIWKVTSLEGGSTLHKPLGFRLLLRTTLFGHYAGVVIRRAITDM